MRETNKEEFERICNELIEDLLNGDLHPFPPDPIGSQMPAFISNTFRDYDNE